MPSRDLASFASPRDTTQSKTGASKHTQARARSLLPLPQKVRRSGSTGRSEDGNAGSGAVSEKLVYGNTGDGMVFRSGVCISGGQLENSDSRVLCVIRLL